jgi:aromatic ring hydroxylase
MSITTGAEYIESLRGRNLRVFLLGERVSEPADHPVIRPSINAMNMLYGPLRSAEGKAETNAVVKPHCSEIGWINSKTSSAS